ncbi:MAG: hypothetical protein J5727_09970 [Kiritimatiellae bacterium]|nr:hypothetical protein [Kiritimatiellia bacterium]
MAVGESSRRKATRAICATAAAVGGVLVFRWVVQAAALHSGRSEREVAASEAAYVEPLPARSLAEMIPADLETNIAGLALRKSIARMGMAYSLAVEVAAGRAEAAGWVRLDDEDALTIGNLSGSTRTYRTPSGSVVQRKITPLVGDDALCTDLEIPVELIPGATETTTPDELARRSGAHVLSKMPSPIGGVIVGSPLFTEVVKRGRGSAFIVHSVADMPPSAIDRQISAKAHASGWTKAAGRERVWLLDNLTFTFATSLRPEGAQCDVDYRFSDDESGLYTKGKQDEN